MSAQFIWYELMTTDLERSLSFFAGLLDADVLMTEGDPPTYYVAAKGTDSPLFGVYKIEPGEGVRSHWIGYLMVDDFDRSIAYVGEVGGQLHAMSEDEEGREAGDPRYAVVTDAQGAVVNLHEHVEGSPSPEAMTGVGRLAWIELMTVEREAAVEFYQNLTEWQAGPTHQRGEEGEANGLFRDGKLFGLVRDLPPGSPVAPNWLFYLRVSDLDVAIAHARQLGAFMYDDPAEVDGGRRVLMMDPTGAPVPLWASR